MRPSRIRGLVLGGSETSARHVDPCPGPVAGEVRSRDLVGVLQATCLKPCGEKPGAPMLRAGGAA